MMLCGMVGVASLALHIGLFASMRRFVIFLLSKTTRMGAIARLS